MYVKHWSGQCPIPRHYTTSHLRFGLLALTVTHIITVIIWDILTMLRELAWSWSHGSALAMAAPSFQKPLERASCDCYSEYALPSSPIQSLLGSRTETHIKITMLLYLLCRRMSVCEVTEEIGWRWWRMRLGWDSTSQLCSNRRLKWTMWQLTI